MIQKRRESIVSSVTDELGWSFDIRDNFIHAKCWGFRASFWKYSWKEFKGKLWHDARVQMSVFIYEGLKRWKWNNNCGLGWKQTSVASVYQEFKRAPFSEWKAVNFLIGLRLRKIAQLPWNIYVAQSSWRFRIYRLALTERRRLSASSLQYYITANLYVFVQITRRGPVLFTELRTISSLLHKSFIASIFN